MPPESSAGYYWQLAGVLIISLMSGFISVGRRLMRRTNPPMIWVLTEFCSAILAGYLAWDAYPNLVDVLPKGVTMPIFVAVCAHFGGRLFQHVESFVEAKLLTQSDSKYTRK